MKIIVSLVTVLFLTAGSLSAQQYGYLDTEKVLLGLPEMKAANERISNLRDSLTAVGQSMVAQLEAKYTDLEKRAQEISPNQQKKELDMLKAEEEQIVNFDQASQQKIYFESQKLIEPIQLKLQKALDEVVEEGNYIYVFDLSAGQILYVDEALNISDKVLAKLQ